MCVRSSSYRRVRSRYDVAALGFVLLCWILLLGAAPVSSEEALGEQRVESVGENSDLKDSKQEKESDVPPEAVSNGTDEQDIVASQGSERQGELADGELYSSIEEIQIQGSRGVMQDVDSTDSSVMFNNEDLQALGVDDISDLAKVTPNLEIRTAGSTSANFFIRGVGLADFSSNAPSAVAIYQDGVALNAPALQRAQIFDVGSVSVLRGPVGSGRGRNASAGAIRIEARKPSGNYEANLLTRLFWYESPDVERSAMGQEYEGGVDIPIVEDWLWSRLSFIVREADPYIRNGCSDTTPTLGPSPSGEDAFRVCGIADLGQTTQIQPGLPAFVGDQGNWGVRGQIRMQPDSGEMDWLLNVHGSRLDQFSTLGQVIPAGNNSGDQIGGSVGSYIEPDQLSERLGMMERFGLSSNEALKDLGPILLKDRPLDTGPYRGDYNRVGQTTRDTWGAVLQGDLFFDSFELNTVTGYEGYKRFRDQDLDFSPLILFENLERDSSWQFSEDIQLGGELLNGDFRWTLGAWYLTEQMEYRGEQETSVPANSVFVRIWSQETQGVAGYGEFAWDFLEDFTLEAGLRYNWEEKTFDYERYVSLDPDGGEKPPQRSATWSSPTGTVQLKYRFSDMTAAYWKYTHGYKSGYFNANEADEPPVKAEEIDAVEFGFRGSWFDGVFSLEADVFYYRYQDYQVFVYTDEAGQGPTLQILNAPRAEVYGSEMQLTLMPLQDLLPEEWSGLRLQANMGWLSSQFLEFSQQVRVAADPRPFLKTVNYAGNKLPNSPDFTIAAMAEWQVDLGSWGTLVPRYDLQWTTDVYFDPTNGRGATAGDTGEPYNPEYTVGQPGYAIHNLQLLYRLPNGMAEVRIWGRNITDTRFKNYAFDATVFRSVIVNFVGEPRTVGFDLSFNF